MATTQRIARRLLLTAQRSSSPFVITRRFPASHTQRLLSNSGSNTTTSVRYASSSSVSDSASSAAASPSSSSSSSSSSSQASQISTTAPAARAPPSGSRAKTLLYAVSLAATGYLVYIYATDTRAFIHRYVIPPLLRTLFPDAEDAHNASVAAMRILYDLGLNPRERPSPSADGQGPDISVQVFGTQLANPIGISAGLDKHAEIPDALFALGASVVEVGGCTPLAQPGNPRPRMFRVPMLDGLVNRYGLNSHGADDMARRLRDRVRRFARSAGLTESEVLDGAAGVPPGSLIPGRILAVQIAKNKDTDEKDVAAVQRDYVYCVRRLAPYADVLVVNVSSPNTPGLRDLQAAEPLARILGGVVEEAQRAERREKPRVLVKVSPDEDEDAQIEGIVQAVRASGVDGIIVGNTTKRRVGVVPPGIQLSAREQAALAETGGYSGPLLFARTEDLVRRYRKMLDAQALGAGSSSSSTLLTAGPAQPGVDDEAVDASLAGIEGTITGMVEDTSPTSKKGAAHTTPTSEGEPVSASATAAVAAVAAGHDNDPAGGAQQQHPKTIWATGGISTGHQALRVLNAGADVAMVYTGLVYGGAGTVTRMKKEMREEMAAGKIKNKEESPKA